jgi:zinc protease
MPDRSKPPFSGLSLKFNLPEIDTFKLKDGLELWFVKREKLPIAFAEFIVYSGSRQDPTGKKGVSYLTSRLIDEGAGEYDSMQLSGEFEKLGTVFSISSDHDATIFSLLSLKENFDRSIELLAKVIFEPRLEEKDFLRERKKVLDQILQLSDEPEFIASTSFEHLLFGDTIYGLPEIGLASDLQKTAIEDVREFYRSSFRSSRAALIIVGNLDRSEIIEKFELRFGNWPSNFVDSPKFIRPIEKEASFFLVNKENSPQSEIRIGHLSKMRNAPDYIPVRIMNAILGGQFSSRINLNLREKKGFTYGASSSFHYYKESAYFAVSTAVDIANSGEAVKEILNEIEGILLSISTEEIGFAKSYLIKQFPSRFETYPQISKNLETLLIHSLQIKELSEFTNRIEGSSAEEIEKAARENIFPGKLIVLVAGDRLKIREGMKNFLKADPIELDLYGNSL